MTRQVLLMEDEAIIAIDLTMTLKEEGYEVAGPFKSEKRAFVALEESMPAIAVLDINLGRGETTFEIARHLLGRNVPIIFLTGYTAATVDFPADLGDITRLMKPVQNEKLLETMETLLAS